MAEGYDLALRIGHMADSSLVSRKISTNTLHFVASPSYLEANGIPQTPDDLEHHNGLLYKNAMNHVNWVGSHINQTQRFKIQSKVVSNSGLALLEMAKAGLGIVNLPRFIIGQSLEKGELIEVLPEYKQQKLEIHVVYPNRRHLPIKVRAFIEFLSGLGLCNEI